MSAAPAIGIGGELDVKVLDNVLRLAASAGLATKKDINRLRKELANSLMQQRIVLFGQGKLDTNLNCLFELPGAPSSSAFYIYKLIQWVDGFYPNAPLISAGWTALFHNNPGPITTANPNFGLGVIADYAPNQSGGSASQLAPLTAEYNGKSAPMFKASESPWFGAFAMTPAVAGNVVSVMAFGEMISISMQDEAPLYGEF